MARGSQKKVEAEIRARLLYEQLMRIKPGDLSERQWTKNAGVSPSFFSNLRGNEKKPPSEPSIGNLRAVIEAAGVSLLDFFALEQTVRLVPTKQALERALSDAFDDLPANRGEWPSYLATTVAGALALPEGRSSIVANEDLPGSGGPEEAAPQRRATTRP